MLMNGLVNAVYRKKAAKRIATPLAIFINVGR